MKTMKLTCQVFLAALLAQLWLAAPAAAQAQAGDNEVLIFANVSMNPDAAGDTAFGFVALNLGRFVTDQSQVGGGTFISISGGGGGFDPVTFEQEGGVTLTLGLNFFVRQYFGGSTAQPYVGGEFSMTDIEDSDSTFINIIGGVKNYVSERAAIDFKGAYGFGLTTPSNDFGFGGGGRAKQLQFSVGLTVLF